MPDPKVSADEMKCFIAILLVSGYCVLPGKKSYWVSQSDVNNALISGAMRRDRFVQIMRFIHCADNTKPYPDDKFWKLRPFMNRLKEKFLKYYQPEQHMSYDEINYELYQGKSNHRSELYEKEYGKAAAPFITMLDQLQDKDNRYELYFDNLFTGLNLLHHLKERGDQGTGTIRENRLPKNCPLSDKKVFLKKERGSYEGVIEKETGTMIVRWLDNNVVTVASTCYGMYPLSSVKRYSSKQNKMITVSRPNMVGKYNSHMGGTDLMDENISRYRIGIRSKKWWWPIFTWLIDATAAY
ncbi:transposase is4 [Holotrichia oblita]|uniref:Transposase is4 n=1 Tax=Holotrichia oblita TaxID=644536 RepID=A0ACB9SVX1_HOLOL|nr:transposase is4 [Holotrichia oblita]